MLMSVGIEAQIGRIICRRVVRAKNFFCFNPHNKQPEKRKKKKSINQKSISLSYNQHSNYSKDVIRD